MAVSTATLFLDFSRDKLLHQYWPRLHACVESLSDDQIWWRPNEASNSIGNLLLHLDGNVTQWLIAPFEHQADTRNRPAEFSERRRLSGRMLLDQLAATLGRADEVMSRLTETELLTTIQVQGYTVTGLDAVYQVVEHFGLHFGQITYITKQLRGADLGFYAALDRTGRLQ